ncbi:unnamed protein product, partial [Prorocentrum cordatum]
GGGGGGGEPRRGFSLPRGVAAWRRLGALALRRWAQCPGRARSPRGAAARPGLRGTGLAPAAPRSGLASQGWLSLRMERGSKRGRK